MQALIALLLALPIEAHAALPLFEQRTLIGEEKIAEYPIQSCRAAVLGGKGHLTRQQFFITAMRWQARARPTAEPIESSESECARFGQKKGEVVDTVKVYKRRFKVIPGQHSLGLSSEEFVHCRYRPGLALQGMGCPSPAGSYKKLAKAPDLDREDKPAADFPKIDLAQEKVVAQYRILTCGAPAWLSQKSNSPSPLSTADPGCMEGGRPETVQVIRRRYAISGKKEGIRGLQEEEFMHCRYSMGSSKPIPGCPRELTPLSKDGEEDLFSRIKGPLLKEAAEAAPKQN